MEYVYPAIFYKDKELPDAWSVIFPDVEGATTCGYSLYEALEMAEDSLAGMLALWEDFKEGRSNFPAMKNRIVKPTPIKDVAAEPDEYSSEAFVSLIKADTDAYRKENPKTQSEDVKCDSSAGGKIFQIPKYSDDLEIPNTYTKEICRVAGIAFPFNKEVTA